MNAVAGIAGLLFVAVITPGPNNLIVMREAARAGWSAALRASLGIIGGSMALLVLVIGGVGSALAGKPGLSTAIAAAGCLYLTLLGGQLISQSFNPRPQPEAGAQPLLPSGAASLFAFQFLNPKAWITTLTAVSAAQASVGAKSALPLLVTLLLLISVPSLALWSSCGVMLTRCLERQLFRVWFDRSAGGLLLGSALLLMFGI